MLLGRGRSVVVALGLSGGLVCAASVPALAADVDHLPAKVTVAPREAIHLSFTAPACGDGWLVDVPGDMAAIKAVKPPKCVDGVTSWTITTTKSAGAKSVVEFTRFGGDGTKIGVLKLTVKVK